MPWPTAPVKASDPDTVRLAVVVQQMVDAEAAGVMFTANPANGRRDQTVISAAWGLGESVVSGSVTTDDVVVEAGTGRVLSRRTADKEVMTVYAERGTREQPVPAARRRQPVLDDRAAAELAGYGTRIAEHFGTPQDIEWARAGGEFFILQSRPITALPEPAADIPDTWPVPYRHGLYFRASIVEQLPDPLSPLFADLIDGSVSRSLRALMADAVGKNVIREDDVGLPTINGYAYYYYRNSGMWRVMGKSLTAMRALARGKAHMGVAGWREFSHPRYEQVIKDWSAKPVGELSGEELLAGVQTLLDAGTVYYTAVQSIIPIAATSEISFRAYYDKFVRRDGDPPAQTFLLGYDSEPIRAEKSLYDLAAWARDVPGLAPAILNEPTAALAGPQRTGFPPAGVDPALWQQWQARFQEHLGRFGHAVYNLDFVSPVPADDPSPLLETVKFYLRGQGNDPYERQRLSAARREDETSRIDRPARAEAPGRVPPAAPVGAKRSPDPRGRPGRRRAGVAAAAADAVRARTTARRLRCHRRARRRVLAAPPGVAQRRRVRPCRVGHTGSRGNYRGRPARPRRRRRGAQDAVAGPGQGRCPATAAGEPVDGAGLRVNDAGRPTGPARRRHQRRRRQRGPGHRPGPRPERARRISA